MNQPVPRQTAPRRTSPERSRGWPREWGDPFGEFTQLWNRMAQPFGRGGPEGWIPTVETEEAEDAYIVRAELPGMKRDNIDIELRGNELRITGEVKADLGKVRSESLSIFGEAKRSRPSILTPAINKVRHYLLARSEKPLEAAD